MPKGIRGRATCSIAECKRLANAEGLCPVHLNKLRRYGEALHEVPRNGRPKRSCSVPGCNRPAYGHGFCSMHWKRWRKTGDPLGLAPRKTPEERFWPKVDKNGPMPGADTLAAGLGPCWMFTGSRNPLGYGRVTIDGRQVPAYRAAYQFVVGPIPVGMDLDHLCRNPPCVNPAHLEAVTHAENIQRGANATPRVCRKGHLRTPANTGRNADGTRKCLICALASHQAASRAYKARQRAKRR